jgi:hypothetical protein
MTAVATLRKCFDGAEADFVEQNVKYLLSTGRRSMQVRIAIVERGDEETVYTVRGNRIYRSTPSANSGGRRVRFTGRAEPRIDGVLASFSRHDTLVGRWVVIAAAY